MTKSHMLPWLLSKCLMWTQFITAWIQTSIINSPNYWAVKVFLWGISWSTWHQTVWTWIAALQINLWTWNWFWRANIWLITSQSQQSSLCLWMQHLFILSSAQSAWACRNANTGGAQTGGCHADGSRHFIKTCNKQCANYIFKLLFWSTP